jgi:hypothetical protein
MRRASSIAIWALCAGLAASCGSNRAAQANNDTGAHAPAAKAFRGQAPDRRQPVDVRGCLTASGDQFVLTELQDASAASKPTTDTFLLTNAAVQKVDLRQYVGREIEVAGEADPPRIADVREGEATTPAATTGQRDQGAVREEGRDHPVAKVGTEEEARFDYRKLAVSSVTPTGNACPAKTGAPAPNGR